MFTRRHLIRTGLAFTALPQAAKAFYDCEVIRYGDLQAGLEMSLWRAVGPQDREATGYALVAPWCPNCKNLMEAALAGKLPMNLRLIPGMAKTKMDQQKVWDLIVHDGEEAIAAFHDRSPTMLTPAEPEAMKVLTGFTDMTLQSCGIWNDQIYGAPLNGTPIVIVFKEAPDSETGTLAQAGVGFAESIIPVYKKLARPIVSQGGPFPKDYFLNLPQTQDMKMRNVNTGPDRGAAYVFPHRESLIFQCYGGGKDLRMKLGQQTVFGEDWLVMKTSDGQQMFLHPDQYTEIS